MDILKELDEHTTVLVLVPATDYSELILSTVKKLSGHRVCYVTLNKTYSSMQDLFKKNKVDMSAIAFIDGITKTINHAPEATEDCIYVSSPGALTELSITITQMLKLKFDYIIFDSITNLLIYQQSGNISKFMSGIMNKIRETESKAVFYSVNTEESSKTVKECCMFVDHVVDLNKQQKKSLQ
jgi:archaellum biogenesis ATPase FlaH